MSSLQTQVVGEQGRTTFTASQQSGDLREEEKKQIKQEQISAAKMLAGAGLSALGFGVAFKDGLNQGFKNIGGIGRQISSIFAIPASLLFPVITAYGEYEEMKGGDKETGQRLTEIVYPLLSAAFAPMTLSDPLDKGTQSNAHLTATALNFPNIAFTLFSYTGSRLFTLFKSLQLALTHPSPEKKFRMEQIRKIFSLFGNIGSDHAASTPGGQQCITGWQTISELFKGDFHSVLERLKTNPVTTILGTTISSVFWVPTYIGKVFDSIIRTAELADHLENALPQNSWITNFLKQFRDSWHEKSHEESGSGELLYSLREFAKVMQTVASPLGMLSVVMPVFDQFTKGFSNKEAKEIGGSIAVFDKALNITAFLGHCYFTLLYALTIRLPQTITTSSFYICNFINKLRGVIDNPEDINYIEPNKIRDIIFNPKKGFVKAISDFAAKQLDNIELKLHPEDPTLINDFTDNNGTITTGKGRSRLIKDLYEVLAEEVCYTPLHEKLYRKTVDEPYIDCDTGELKKPEDKIPSPELWGKILKDNEQNIIRDARLRFDKYLDESTKFSREEKEDFYQSHINGEQSIYERIKTKVEILLKNEIDSINKPTNESQDAEKIEKIKLKSKSFFEIFTNPIKYLKDIKEVLSFRAFISKFVILPLNILGFVNAINFGERGMPHKLRKWLTQESAIRIGNYKIANEGELPPVAFHAFQTAGKGMANIYNAFRFIFLKQPFPSFSE